MSITTERKAEVIKTYAVKIRRYGFAGGSGCAAVGADQQPDRTLQDAYQRQPFAARAAQARFAAPANSRLSAAHQRRTLQRVDRTAGYPPLKTCARLIPRARWRSAKATADLPAAQAADFERRAEGPSHRMKVRRPWQDRRTLDWHGSFAAPTASRRLAYGFRAFAKTMRDNRNVQYSSCPT